MNNSIKEKILDICKKNLIEKGLFNDTRYQKRLKWEIEEIEAKNKIDYFYNLYEKNIRYAVNQNNLLICWLLGVVPEHSIELDPTCTYGDFPDIDSDYIQQVRNYIKESWAPKTFGEEYVCNIGNYTTFGIKSALIDMVRVYGKSRDEILGLTKSLDAKDDEGKDMTWDAAMKLYPDLKKYCSDNKDIAESAKKLLHRNRGMGVHAGGLIISSTPLSDLVPLVKRKDSPQASSWVEGLHGQDLQPVGLVKFDLLVVSNLLQVALCCELVKSRHNLESICALKGRSDWSDVAAWRNDPLSISMANIGDLKGIFQFDSETVRNMCRTGGVDNFEDLVAYTSLNRPSALNMKMQERYIERKKKREDYQLHPLMQPILGETYGVMIYQEQVMRVLNVVGNIPLKDCELVRKAISKKKVESFIKYKEAFLINGKKNLGISEEAINQLYQQVEAFSEYGFNRSHAVAYTYISSYLLYLKSHYPNEFYTSILRCEKSSEKIKEYKMEAKGHGVQVCGLDINRSKISFDLQEDIIYFGFSNIKGIGEAPATRIIECQPYKGFEDFIERFGTDANVLKPLIGLRCFTERDPVTLWRFSERYKNYFKKKEEKQKRHIATMLKYDNEFKSLFPNETTNLSDIKGTTPYKLDYWKKYDVEEVRYVEGSIKCEKDEDGAIAKLTNGTVTLDCGVTIEKEIVVYYKKVKNKKSFNPLNSFKKLWDKRNRSIEKNKNNEKNSPKLGDFNDLDAKLDAETEEEISNYIACERKYYGFSLAHPLEFSPDHNVKLTFNNLRDYTTVANNSEKGSPSASVGPVEVCVIKTNKTKSKKGTVYYHLTAEDITGQENKIIIWQDDWERWKEEFLVGNLLRLRLQAPSNGFFTFSLESNQHKPNRRGKNTSDKKDDFRVAIMKKGVIDNTITQEDCLMQFEKCTMKKQQ